MGKIKLEYNWFIHSLCCILCYNWLIIAIILLLKIDENTPYIDIFFLIWGMGNGIIPIIIGIICFIIKNKNMFNFKKIFRYLNFFKNPCKNCIIYKEIGCSYAKSDLCDYPICSLLKDYKNAKKHKE